jgi:microcystin-dependent protein
MAAGVVAIAAMVQGAAGAPASFAYQGVIHELGGNVPTNKNRLIEFRIYGDATSSDALWGRACNVLLDQNGLFNAALADTSGTRLEGVPDSKLTEVLAQKSGTMLYVGLTVDGSSGEISPRQAILAVPYAIHADDAASASGDFVVAGALKADTLTVSNATELASVEAARLSVEGNVEIIGGDGMFKGPGTIPVGGIIMWNGSADSIPEDWALCDGNNETPDLSGRFVVGYNPNDSDYNTIGNTGGAAVVKLTSEQIPQTRALARSSGDLGSEEAMGDGAQNGTENDGVVPVIVVAQPHENRPPYYVICYIMRIR